MIVTVETARRNWHSWREDWARRDNWTRFCMGWEFLAVVNMRRELSR